MVGVCDVVGSLICEIGLNFGEVVVGDLDVIGEYVGFLNECLFFVWIGGMCGEVLEGVEKVVK